VTTRYAVEDLTGNLSGRQQVTTTYADGTTVARTIDNSSSSRAGLPLWEVISNAQSEELLRTTYAWQDGDYESSRLETIIELIARQGLNQTRRKEFEYGPRHNQLSNVRDYDYEGRLLRRTHTDYLDDPAYRERHIFNLPTVTAVYEGDSNTPVTLTVKDSRADLSSISCANESLRRDLVEYLSTDSNSNRLGEFAIGTNLALTSLTGNMLQDEKFPSVHCAFGNPLREETGADWESKTHIDGLVLKSSIWVDGRKIMDEGKHLIE